MIDPQKPNLLLIGAQSSIGQHFLLLDLGEHYNVYSTYSSNSVLGQQNARELSFVLDLEIAISIESFMQELLDIRFDVVIFLIGKTSKLSITSSDESISNYLDTYIRNYAKLIFGIAEKIAIRDKNKALFVNVSSRSVIYGSSDPFYAIVKSAIHSYIKSLSRLYSSNIEFHNLVPGLLKNSRMYLDMDPQLQSDHEKRSGGKLMSVDDFALYLKQFILINHKMHVDEIDIRVGPQYK
jgi:short-subunit dehydrogenase involved in D-alanine esterification of teichoic acids